MGFFDFGSLRSWVSSSILGKEILSCLCYHLAQQASSFSDRSYPPGLEGSAESKWFRGQVMLKGSMSRGVREMREV